VCWRCEWKHGCPPTWGEWREEVGQRRELMRHTVTEEESWLWDWALSEAHVVFTRKRLDAIDADYCVFAMYLWRRRNRRKGTADSRFGKQPGSLLDLVRIVHQVFQWAVEEGLPYGDHYPRGRLAANPLDAQLALLTKQSEDGKVNGAKGRAARAARRARK
jgi:hypothetical protein